MGVGVGGGSNCPPSPQEKLPSKSPALLLLKPMAFLLNLVIQADTLNTSCNLYLSSKKSNKSFCLTVVANILLIILASSQILWTQLKDWLTWTFNYFLLSGGFCLVGIWYHFMYSFSNILLTLYATNYLESPCLFNQCKTTVLSIHPMTDLIL